MRGLASAACALAVATVVAGCGLTGSSSSPRAGSAVGVRVYDPPVRLPAAISGTTLGGRPLAAGYLSGHVTVVNFWQSWCAPCAAEAPALAATARRFASAGVRFLGVDVTDSAAAGRRFETAHHVPYPSVRDPAALLLARFGHYVPPAATPSTLVIDRSGQLAGTVIGRATAAELATLIRRAERLA